MLVSLLTLGMNDDLATPSTTALGTIWTIRQGRGVFFSSIRVQWDRKGVYWRGFPLDFLNRDMSVFLGIDIGGSSTVTCVSMLRGQVNSSHYTERSLERFHNGFLGE